MSLDGLRAWIGEVERKLGMRTRVFLLLATIAIGGAGAAVYLALETREDAVTESDVRALQEDLEAQIVGGGASAGTGLSDLEADLRALEDEVDRLRGRNGDGGGAANGAATDPGGDGDGATASSERSTDSGDGAAADGGSGDTGAGGPLPKLLEKAEEEGKPIEVEEDSKDGP